MVTNIFRIHLVSLWKTKCRTNPAAFFVALCLGLFIFVFIWSDGFNFMGMGLLWELIEDLKHEERLSS